VVPGDDDRGREVRSGLLSGLLERFPESAAPPLEPKLQPLELRATIRQRSRARGAGSGIEVDIDFWCVWTLDDDGLATQLEFYLDHQRAEALEAAGLQE
jgi:hypothetical protein